MVSVNRIGGERRLGDRQPELDPQRYDIEKIIQHPEWNLAEFSKGNDIALVRVKGLIKLYVSLVSWNHIKAFLCLHISLTIRFSK